MSSGVAARNGAQELANDADLRLNLPRPKAAPIGGRDGFAHRLKIAAKILADGVPSTFVKER